MIGANFILNGKLASCRIALSPVIDESGILDLILIFFSPSWILLQKIEVKCNLIFVGLKNNVKKCNVVGKQKENIVKGNYISDL